MLFVMVSSPYHNFLFIIGEETILSICYNLIISGLYRVSVDWDHGLSAALEINNPISALETTVST